MAEKETVVEKVAHSNIYAALAGFQGEKVVIARTKKVSFGSGDKKVEYMYAPLDEFLNVVKPLTAKHGLSFVWQQGEEKSTMVCVLFHETYEMNTSDETTETKFFDAGSTVVSRIETSYGMVEKNVIRSMPIKVKREGDMKGIGGDSTYARRYTLGEVLGIASEDDNDAAYEEARLEKAEGFAFKQALAQVKNAKDEKKLKEHTDFFVKELAAIEKGKAPSIGLKKEQYEELQVAAASRLKELRGEDEPAIDLTAPATEPAQ